MLQVRSSCDCMLKRSLSTTFELKTRSQKKVSLARLERPPANTKLSTEDVFERRKAVGGLEKWKAISTSKAKYILQSKDIENEYKILDIAYNGGLGHGKVTVLKDLKILTKAAIVVIDAKSLLDQVHVEEFLTDDSLPDEASTHFRDMFNSGKLYARVTSRPGQVGDCNGVILEGKFLSYMLTRKLGLVNDGHGIDMESYTPEEIMEVNMKHLVSNFDQSPRAVKHKICERLWERRKSSQSFNLRSLDVEVTSNGHRDMHNWMKKCSDRSSGELFHDGCRNFVDTFAPYMFYNSGLEQKITDLTSKDYGKEKSFLDREEWGFRSRTENDPQPRPSLYLLNAFKSLEVEGDEIKSEL